MKDELKLKILAEGILANCNEPLMHDVDDGGNEILVCYYCERKKGDKVSIQHKPDCAYRLAKEILGVKENE